MGIWVRSQDKKVLVESYSIQYSESWLFNVGHYVCSNNFCLGEYSIKDKVLKVLDMIQNFIKDTTYASVEIGGGISRKVLQSNDCKVFEMPQDYEV